MGYLPKKADWSGFYDRVVSLASDGEGKRLRTYWYVVENCDAFPAPLSKGRRSPADFESWVKHNARALRDHPIPAAEPERVRHLNELQAELYEERNRLRSRFDGITTLQNGIMHKHRAIEFRRSGSISANLIDGRFGSEKTVDVNLAVDMVTLKNNYDLAVIVSGDQDYVPAAQAVKDTGKSVVNVAFKTRSGILLPGGARRLNQATDWSVEMDWEDTRRHLNIEIGDAIDGRAVEAT